MLQVSRIRTDKAGVTEALTKRGWNTEKLAVLDKVLKLDDARKALQTENDGYLSERNKLSKEIGQLFKDGKQDEAAAAKSKVEELKTKISDTESKLSSATKDLEELLLDIPNAPHSLLVRLKTTMR